MRERDGGVCVCGVLFCCVGAWNDWWRYVEGGLMPMRVLASRMWMPKDFVMTSPKFWRAY